MLRAREDAVLACEVDRTFPQLRRLAPAWIFAILLAAAPASAQVIDGYIKAREPVGTISGVHTYKPPYPAEAKRRREQVIGVLRMFVGRSGSIDRVEIIRSTGTRSLMEYARVFALRRWQAEPRPIPPGSKGRWRDVPIIFMIEDGDELLRYVEKVRGPNHPDAIQLREASRIFTSTRRSR